jgi:uncharacterized protein (TIRG00374 family)
VPVSHPQRTRPEIREGAPSRQGLGLPDLKRYLGWLFTIIVLLFLVIFASKQDWRAIGDAVRSAKPGWVAAAAAVNFLSMVVKGVRWWIFLRPAGVTSLGLAVRASLAGAALNNVIVANGGDAARVVFVARKAGVESAPILATLVFDRLFDVAGYIALLAGAALVLHMPPRFTPLRVPAAVVLVTLIVVLVWLARRRHPSPEAVAAEVAPPGATLAVRVRAYFHRFTLSLSALASGRRFAAASALSLIAWALQIATFHLCAIAAGYPISLEGSIVTLLAVNLGYAIRATPGNVGFFQAVYAETAVRVFRLSQSGAIAVSFLIQAVQIIPVTLIGLALAAEFRLTPPAKSPTPTSATTRSARRAAPSD